MAKRQHDLVAALHQVKELVAALPAFDFDRPAPFRRAEEAAVDRLRADGARITSGGDGVSIVYAGVRSGSTSGTSGALRNWIGTAQRKLDQQAIARMSK